MIILYKGISLKSRIIRFVNWSCYSHAAWEDDDTEECYEAWKNGVRCVSSIHDDHTPGTPYDRFLVAMTDAQRGAVRRFLTSTLGAAYDHLSVFHFITRRPEDPLSQVKWFCSELVMASFLHARIELLSRIPPYKVYPGMLSYSPKLDHVGSGVTHER